MDTGSAQEDPGKVAEGIALIKAQMPETYRAIQKRSQQCGSAAFRLVRRGLRGEANCFCAFERGHVVGTPFADHPISHDLARLMVQFGGTFLCIWGRDATPPSAGEADGAH